MNNKLSFLLILILLFGLNSVLLAQQDSLDFPAPQYMLPFYDHFSQNHLNVDAMGRGFTTMAVLGKAENAVNNPAALSSDKSAMYMELTIKPPIEEINEPDSMMYSSPIPFGLIGLSGRIYKELYGAISYNVPKSLVYDNFSIEILQGNDVVTRYPTYYLHQVTATLAGNIGKLRLGLNIQNQFHQFNDIIVFQTFDRIDKTYYVSRIQPGILYQWDNLRVGAAFLPETTVKMDIRYTEYDVTLPMKISGGIKAEIIGSNISADVDWEQFSKMDSKFDDRLTLKAGIEKRVRNYTYRAGLISFPGVYQGPYRLPFYNSTEPDHQLWWNSIARGGIIGDTDQLYATIGLTYHFEGGKLSLGLMRDVLDHVPTTQFAMALGFNLDTLKGKKFLIFD